MTETRPITPLQSYIPKVIFISEAYKRYTYDLD